MRDEIIGNLVRARVPERGLTENWELAELGQDLARTLNLHVPAEEWGREDGMDEHALEERIQEAARQAALEKEQRFGADTMRFIEKSVLIQVLDTVWKEHLYALDHLRQGIGLRAYGQRDPLNEYKSEAFVLFNFLLDELKARVTTMLSRVEIAQEQPPAPMPFASVQAHEMHPDPGSAFAGGSDVGLLEPPAWSESAVLPAAARTSGDAVDPANPSTWGTVGRNAMCPCGSGRSISSATGGSGSPLVGAAVSVEAGWRNFGSGREDTAGDGPRSRLKAGLLRRPLFCSSSPASWSSTTPCAAGRTQFSRLSCSRSGWRRWQAARSR